MTSFSFLSSLTFCQRMENEQSDLLSLKVLVEKEKNRVVFLVSDKYFIDVLCSFMALPLATIIRLTSQNSLDGEIGCLSSLYESVKNLDEDYLQRTDYKDMLLHPRSAAEIYHSNLKVRLIERNKTDYYACSNGKCYLLSYYQSTRCRCGSALTTQVDISDTVPIPQEKGGFVKPTASFMINDDFQVMPVSTKTRLVLLEKASSLDGSKIEERTINNIGRNEVLKLLKHSLVSRTPFTDTFLEPPASKAIYSVRHGKYGPRRKIEGLFNIDPTRISLKIIVNKAKNKAIYAEAKEDFVDLLCSFLTFPLGFVFREFPSLTFKGCIGNFYKTIKEFDSKQFMAEETKEAIVNPHLAPGLSVSNKLIGIGEAVHSLISVRSYVFKPASNISGQAEDCKGFIKGPSIFMVTDNLTITPLSAISGISLIKKLKIPLLDIEERQVDIDEDEALHLLVATLASKYALTDAFLRKEQKKWS